MGKTLAAVVLWVAGVGGFAYYTQSGKAPVPIQSPTPAPVQVQAFDPEPAASPPPPLTEKSRTMEAYGFAQVGATKTLTVFPPAEPPYSITLTLNNLMGTDAYVGINPADKLSIYPDPLVVGPFTNPALRNRLPVVWAFRTTNPDHILLFPDGTIGINPNSKARWTVIFRAQEGGAVYGGGLLQEANPSPLTTTLIRATAGWSFRLND